MNIFYLHDDPQTCAMFHCDKHVVKMIIEYAQMLSTSHRLCDSNPDDNLYKIAHKNHPSTIWTRSSKINYLWLHDLWKNLCREYTYRYEKIHITQRKLEHLLIKVPDQITHDQWTELPQCMPEEYKTNDPMSAYRMFYIYDKSRFAKWTTRPQPLWYWNGSIDSQLMVV